LSTTWKSTASHFMADHTHWPFWFLMLKLSICPTYSRGMIMNSDS
jgi:hypothetical protein